MGPPPTHRSPPAGRTAARPHPQATKLGSAAVRVFIGALYFATLLDFPPVTAKGNLFPKLVYVYPASCTTQCPAGTSVTLFYNVSASPAFAAHLRLFQFLKKNERCTQSFWRIAIIGQFFFGQW